MPNYQPYSPDQAELLPAHVKDVLGPDHLCFLVHEVVESFDRSGFERDEEGQRAYDPRLMLIQPGAQAEHRSTSGWGRTDGRL